MSAYNTAVMNSLNQSMWMKSPGLCSKVFTRNDNQNHSRVCFSMQLKASNIKASMVTGRLPSAPDLEIKSTCVYF